MNEIIDSNKESSKPKEDETLEDFQIKKMIGKGVYGKTFLVQNNISLKHYQLKCIRKDVVLEAKKVGSLKIEKEVLTSLKHPFFVKIEHSY